MPRIKGFDEIEAELERHPGKIAHDEWTNLKRIFVDIYQRNRRELIQLFEEPSQNDELSFELMQNVRPPIVRDAYTNEVLRSLFNYLSSLSSLVDAGMRLADKYSDEQMAPYNVQKKAILAADSNAFFHNLRNYIQHYGIPPLGWIIQVKTREPNICTYYLANEKLLAWGGWNAKAKAFIGTADVDLLQAVHAHGAMVDSAYTTLLTLFPDIHTADTDDFNKLMRRRNAILSGEIKL